MSDSSPPRPLPENQLPGEANPSQRTTRSEGGAPGQEASSSTLPDAGDEPTMMAPRERWPAAPTGTSGPQFAPPVPSEFSTSVVIDEVWFELSGVLGAEQIALAQRDAATVQKAESGKDATAPARPAAVAASSGVPVPISTNASDKTIPTPMTAPMGPPGRPPVAAPAPGPVASAPRPPQQPARPAAEDKPPLRRRAPLRSVTPPQGRGGASRSGPHSVAKVRVSKPPKPPVQGGAAPVSSTPPRTPQQAAPRNQPPGAAAQRNQPGIPQQAPSAVSRNQPGTPQQAPSVVSRNQPGTPQQAPSAVSRNPPPLPSAVSAPLRSSPAVPPSAVSAPLRSSPAVPPSAVSRNPPPLPGVIQGAPAAPQPIDEVDDGDTTQLSLQIPQILEAIAQAEMKPPAEDHSAPAMLPPPPAPLPAPLNPSAPVILPETVSARESFSAPHAAAPQRAQREPVRPPPGAPMTPTKMTAVPPVQQPAAAPAGSPVPTAQQSSSLSPRPISRFPIPHGQPVSLSIPLMHVAPQQVAASSRRWLWGAGAAGAVVMLVGLMWISSTRKEPIAIQQQPGAAATAGSALAARSEPERRPAPAPEAQPVPSAPAVAALPPPSAAIADRPPVGPAHPVTPTASPLPSASAVPSAPAVPSASAVPSVSASGTPVVAPVPDIAPRELARLRKQLERCQMQGTVKEILAQVGDVVETRLDLGRCAVQAGRFEEGLGHYHVALERRKDEPWAFLGLGRAYQQHGDAQQALLWYRKYAEVAAPQQVRKVQPIIDKLTEQVSSR